MKPYYIKNGKRYEGLPDGAPSSSQAKAHDHAKQRREHRADIAQPYNPDGTLNKDFQWLYPDQAKLYKRD